MAATQLQSPTTIVRISSVRLRRLTFSLVALILASNYLAFQAELFDEEYEANHPQTGSVASITSPSLNWESFDKNNAPPAFVFDAGLRTEILFTLSSPSTQEFPAQHPFRVIRDKSPPPSSLL